MECIMTMSKEDWDNLGLKASEVFTPSAPIDEQRLFAGRKDQLRQVMDSVHQKGQHAIIFGERGVGKTSLANIIPKIFGTTGKLAIRVNADNTDDYSKLWHKIFDELKIIGKTKRMGFEAEADYSPISLSNAFIVPGENITPGNIRQILATVSNYAHLAIIIDEFDRIKDEDSKIAMADTIKTFSDHAINVTIVLVGVADSVDGLIKEHQSIERALKQIQMPRMSGDELKLIIDYGLEFLNMTIDEDAKKHITLLSQGLPHYTHLLSLCSVRQAIDARVTNITLAHVEAAISKAIGQAQQTTLSAFHKAITSPRKDNIFLEVLIACALAKTDELGYFAAADVKGPLSKIKKKKYEIYGFSRHLNDFCDADRGPILSKIGKKRRYRFRFVNPLMQPFVVMQGVANRSIDKELLE